MSSRMHKTRLKVTPEGVKLPEMLTTSDLLLTTTARHMSRTQRKAACLQFVLTFYANCLSLIF